METSFGQKITISPHASKRIKERLVKGFSRENIISAFEDGEELTEKQAQILFQKGLYNQKYWTSIYRQYQGNLYVFRKSGKSYVLITVL